MADPKDLDLEIDNDADQSTPTDENGDEGDTDALEADSEVAAESDGAEPDEAGDEGAVDAPKPRSRGEARFQKLANEAKEAREEAAKVRRELNEFRSQQRQPVQQGESLAEEAARMALMTAEERMDYKLDKATRTHQQNLNHLAFQQAESMDSANFRMLVKSDPVAARYADRVEAKLQEIRRAGQNVNREALLDLLVGQDVRAKRGSAEKKQKGEADKRIQRQQVKAPNSKGDVAAERRGGKSLEDRLANVTV